MIFRYHIYSLRISFVEGGSNFASSFIAFVSQQKYDVADM